MIAASLAFSRSGRLLAALEAEGTYRKNIGLQLYTLRNEIGKDTLAAIKQVAADGYKQVELYGFPNADAMIEAAKSSGLSVNSSHFEWASVVNPKDDSMSDFAKILEKAEKIGLKHFVIPYFQDTERATLDHYKKIAANANKAAAMAKKAGVQLAYPNHNFEFERREGCKRDFDVFVEEFSSDMKLEVDVFWVKAAALDPVTLINKLKGRVTQLHLKDLKDESICARFFKIISLASMSGLSKLTVICFEAETSTFDLPSTGLRIGCFCLGMSIDNALTSSLSSFIPEWATRDSVAFLRTMICRNLSKSISMVKSR